jgi:uncharacterized protein YlxP (DUF503 family)
MFAGIMDCDLLLGDVHSLKGKRAVIRPVLARLRRFGVSAAEVGDADLHRRARLAVAVVSGEAAMVGRVLDECERVLADDRQFQVLSIRRRLVGPDD